MGWIVKRGLFVVLSCMVWQGGFAQVQAQTLASDEAILFVWNDRLMAQPLDDGTLQMAPARIPADGLVSDGLNVTAFADSPLTATPAEGYGFHQGVWSSDRSRFAYVMLAADRAAYRVQMTDGDTVRLLISGNVNPERGYLIPAGWNDDNTLILLERYSLHTLNEVRVWAYDVPNSRLNLLQTFDVPPLKGNSALLEDGRIFTGFDTTGLRGYLLDAQTMTLSFFQTGFVLQDPPGSVFEIYPVTVEGTVQVGAFRAWATAQETQPEATPSVAIDAVMPDAIVQPFLHWPLPDYARSVTCYPDSAYTDSLYDVECPGLQTPRAYTGHEGTDVGGKPAGLAPGTPVYAASAGLVLAAHTTCERDDITCADAYGNYVLLQHTRIINHTVQTWFTGYAHLQTVLTEPGRYVEQIGLPIALSGATGLGGAHLHFEVRSPAHVMVTNWIDPWDSALTGSDGGLWVIASTEDGMVKPVSAVVAFPPPTRFICRTQPGNNIRSGPGVNYEIVKTSNADIAYEVFQVQVVTGGDVPGEWYQMHWDEGRMSGWIWSELMSDCRDVTTAGG